MLNHFYVTFFTCNVDYQMMVVDAAINVGTAAVRPTKELSMFCPNKVRNKLAGEDLSLQRHTCLGIKKRQ